MLRIRIFKNEYDSDDEDGEKISLISPILRIVLNLNGLKKIKSTVMSVSEQGLR